MPHLPDLWIVWSLAQGEVTPGRDFRILHGEKEKEELQLLRGGKLLWGGGQRCSHHTRRYIHNMSYVYTVYNTRAHRHTHTHTVFLMVSLVSTHFLQFMIYTSVCLGQSEPSEASEKKQKKASAPKPKAAGGHPKLFAGFTPRLFVLACFITSYFCLFGGICHGFANVFLKYIAVRYCKHLSFQEPGSKNQQVVFLVHFWKMYHVLPDLELFDNSHSLGSIQ